MIIIYNSYHEERFLTNFKKGEMYYSYFQDDHFYNTQYLSKSLNKCIETSATPWSRHHYQVVLKDFEKGTEKVLADSVNEDWYMFDNFTFTDDETKIAFQFRDKWNLPDVRSIYWMETDP
jgi:hypothetical protein